MDESNEANKISTNDLIKSKKVIILGMPGAFTKTCSAVHLPGYVKNMIWLKKGITKIICIAVNDPKCNESLGEKHNVSNKIFMVGDPFCKFTKAIGAEVDKSQKGLGMRSNRYAMLIEEGIITKIEQEKETATCELTAAENFLKGL